MKVKNPSTARQQIQKLKERGCIVNDEIFAEKILENINYYRLVNYFEPFSDEKKYIEGTTFEKIYNIYEFDRKLRVHLLAVLEEIEIMLRAKISNYHANKYGALGYLNSETFNPAHNHTAFLSKVKRSIETNEELEFVKHHINKYNGQFPLWVMMEMFSFGTLCYFFIDLCSADKKEIAALICDYNYRYVENWMMCLLDLRNKCAHYNRLYGSYFEKTPKTPSDMLYQLNNTLFDYIFAMKFLFYNKIEWTSFFIPQLNSIISQYNDYIELQHLGFPAGWEEMLSADYFIKTVSQF